MYKILYTALVIIWIIDICNIDFIINEIHIAELLDKTIPINFWFWLLLWLFIPSAETYRKKGE